MEKKEVFLPDGVCGKAGTIKAFKYKTRDNQTAEVPNSRRPVSCIFLSDTMKKILPPNTMSCT